MVMSWFLPLSIFIGIGGSRTASRSRHTIVPGWQDSSWWLLLLLSWFPLVCWFLAQFVVQG